MFFQSMLVSYFGNTSTSIARTSITRTIAVFIVLPNAVVLLPPTKTTARMGRFYSHGVGGRRPHERYQE